MVAIARWLTGNHDAQTAIPRTSNVRPKQQIRHVRIEARMVIPTKFLQ
jgi:hypothetical protein